MIEREKLHPVEMAPKVVSFATIEHFLEELRERPPDLGLVRIDRRVMDRPGKDGFGVRTGGVFLSAKRGEEILVADFVTGRTLTLNGRPWGSEEEVTLLQENTDKALAVLEDEVKQAGFTLGRGVYALPDELILYQARCQRLTFRNGRVMERGEVEKNGP